MSSMSGGVTKSPKGLTETEIELRQTLVFRLRAERRMSFRQIADALKVGTVHNGQSVTFDISYKQAMRDYRAVMNNEGYAVQASEVAEHRADQLEQCERIKAGHASKAFAGDERAAGLYLRVLDHEAKLCGLYIPIPEQHDIESDAATIAGEVEMFLRAVEAVRARDPDAS